MKNYSSKIIKMFLPIIVLAFSFLFFNFCQATILYFEPNQKEYRQGDVFIQEIRLNTQGEYINTAEINLSFPKDILEVKDISKGNSILTLWAKEPTFSNEEGKIFFIGGIPAGYQGWSGLLIKIIFKVSEKVLILNPEVIQLKFLDNSQVLLNDGFGTSDDLEKKQCILTILPKEMKTSRNEWQIELEEDTILPEPFSIEIYQDESIFNGKYFLIFSAIDKQTGIDFYEIKEGDNDWQKQKSPYLLEDQGLKSIIRVRAVDKAENERIISLDPIKQVKQPFYYWITTLILIGIIWYIVIRKLKTKSKIV